MNMIVRLAKVITETARQNFDHATACYLCHKKFESTDDMKKVWDHCHISGLYRGAAHSKCNLKLKQSRDISVLLHNFKNYDSHPIVLALHQIKDKFSNIDCLAKGIEKYMSISITLRSRLKNMPFKIIFKDSYQFLSASLEKLVESLNKSGGTEKFNTLKHFFRTDYELSLLTRKGVCPYQYVDTIEKLSDDCLPPIEKFYSSLKNCHISNQDYAHAKNVWTTFNCKTLRDYWFLYLKSDVLQLADVFENFRSLVLTEYSLDPCHYWSLPGLSWDACLKYTKAQLPTITDRDMYDMIYSGIKGGVSVISHRYAQANNKDLPTFDQNALETWLYYIDANNLYGFSMTKKLPYDNFEWHLDHDWDSLQKKFAIQSESGYIIEVDLEYPSELHDEHNDFPLAPENLTIDKSMISEYSNDPGTVNEKHTTKLVGSLLKKENYVCDYRILMYYVSKGMKVTKVHRVIEFREKDWMGNYIIKNNTLRTHASTEFERDLFKLMNNAVFGKTIENVYKYVNVKLVTSEEKARKLMCKPWATYGTHKIFSENLVAIHMPNKTVRLDKPIYLGFSILELSKLHMFQMHYDVIRKQFEDRARLLFTDTDSLCYQIQSGDINEELLNIRDHLDTSKYSESHPQYNLTNKNVLGKFKDECAEKQMIEFVGLRSKLYAFACDDGCESKKAKGVTKSVIAKNLNLNLYKSVLFDREKKHISMNIIRSQDHEIYLSEAHKIGLNPFDDKRYILNDGISTLAHGHYRLKQ